MTRDAKRASSEPDARELRRVRSLIEDLEGVIWEADARTLGFTYVSEGATRILGYTPQEWLAEPNFWADHLHPDDRREMVSRLTGSAISGQAFDVEYRALAKDGRVVWLHGVGHVLL